MAGRPGRDAVEAGAAGPPAPRPSPSPVAAPAHTPSPSQERRNLPTPPGRSFEEIFGGRVLAWIGGVAILLGVVLFLGIGDQPRLDRRAHWILISLFGSTALLLIGVWLHERKGKPDAALAAVGSAISGLFATLIVATQVYDLVPAGLGLLMAALVAAVALALAVRWSSRLVAALGALGALAAPILVGTGPSGVSIAFLAIALAAISAILLWQRWDWLGLGAFAISAPQLGRWAFEQLGGWEYGTQTEHVGLVLAVAAGFWLLYAAAALGYELRAKEESRLPVSSWLLLFGATALLATLGYYALEGADFHSLAVAWLLGIAAVEIAFGALARRLRVHREISTLPIAIGLGLVALAMAAALDGPVLVVTWAVEAVVLAFLATHADDTSSSALSDAERLMIAAAGLLIAAFGHVLLIEAPPDVLLNGVNDLGAAVAGILACSAAAIVCGLLGRSIEPTNATAAIFAGAAGLVYLGSVAIVATVGVTAAGEVEQAGQVWLSAFWTITGLGAVVYGLLRQEPSVRLGGLSLLALAIAKVYIYDLSELDELARVLSFVALGLLLLVGAFAYQRILVGVDENGGDGGEER